MSSVTEVKQAPGRWDLQLKAGTPREIIDALTPFGHIAIAPGKIDVAQVGDNLLRQARYVGVYRGGKVAGEDYALQGSGVPFWLGDEDGKGPLIESVSASSATFAQTINLVLPAAVEVGTIHSVAGSMTHTFQWETAKSAMNFIVGGFATPTVPVSWRVNGDATLDAGPDSSLFNLNPTAILVKKDQVLRTGRGFDIVGISGDLQLETMYNDYTTQVVVLGQGESGSIVAASASLAASAIPYLDMHGNKVAFTRLVDELDADAVNVAPALAASLLSRFDSPTYGATLSSDDYDVRGDFAVGDHVAVFSPDIGFVDYTHEMYYEGVPINPMFLQCVGLTWPIEEGFTVGFRTQAGTWYDLSDYYKPSTGQTLIDVGDNPSGLTSIGFDIDRARIIADASVPAVPVFGTFYTSNYLNSVGETRAQILITWTEPDNTDGSTITDGSHYEIRYRPNTTLPYSATWGEAAQDTWDELFTWAQPRVPPFDTTEWHTLQAPFDVEQFMVNELFPSVTYEFQIRAVDTANPPNRSAWSASQALTAARDTIPPAQPAAPSVAGSRLAIQVTHHLGISAGGTFNLDLDTHHLEVHVSGDPLFFPDDSSLVGRLQVNAALASGTPVVGTFQVEEITERYVRVVAVDREGNRSNASNTATATAELVDDAHISDLTASKITAGTITSDLIVGGSIFTAPAGQRVGMTAEGLFAYDDDGDLTVNISSAPTETGQFIQFRDGEQILASIDDAGVASFQQLYAQNVWVPGGHLLDDYVELRPRGIVAFGSSLEDRQGRGPDQHRGYMEVAFDAEDGRTYKITTFGEFESDSSVGSERFTSQIYDGGTEIPTVDHPTMGAAVSPSNESTVANTSVRNELVKRCPEDIDAGLHRLLWGFKATNGTATVRGSDGPAVFYIEDIGPSDWYENIGVIQDGGYDSAGEGGGVSSDSKNAMPRKSYIRTYTCDWSGTYIENDVPGFNTFTLVDGLNDVRQGFSSTYGQHLGVFAFPEQMVTDLTDANIVQMQFSFYSHWWSQSSGGTVKLGYYDALPLRPPTEFDTTDIFSDIQEVEDVPKIGTKSVRLDPFFRDQAEFGVWSAIIVYTPLTDTIYRGRFDGAAETHPATLRVTFTKG